MIRFGPSGLGGVKEAIHNLEEYFKMGIRVCEIAFTYGVYINNKKDALEIGEKARKLGISLSIHAPYWINLNSEYKEKIEKSKQRILKCCEVGTYLGAKKVVFHPGYYGKKSKEETYENIKKEIMEMQEERKEKKYPPELAPETTGKINVFGSVEEIKNLTKDTGCSFCIDFAHILAREKDYKFEEVFETFKNFKEIHIHFSGIAYGEKGEKNHIGTEEKDIIKLIEHLPKNKDITIINESPSPVKDSIISSEILEAYKTNNCMC
ncbi:MAG: TIM barrel protein [archaeon]